MYWTGTKPLQCCDPLDLSKEICENCPSYKDCAIKESEEIKEVLRNSKPPSTYQQDKWENL